MEFKHIRDCWNALAECTTAVEIAEMTKNFPNWAGDWDVEVEDGEVKATNICNEDGNYEMSVEYYDADLTDFEDYADEKLLDTLYHKFTPEELEKLGAFVDDDYNEYNDYEEDKLEDDEYDY